MFLRIIFLFLFFLTKLGAEELKECEWDNRDGVPCLTISKTSNTSAYNKGNVVKKVFNKKNIEATGAKDTFDLLKLIPGLDYYQSGQKGQTGAIFLRGSESNHTLVLLNGIPINDQSTTNGIHDFGQDFIQTVQQIEIYKGSNGSHFGPDAIGGAINFITDVDYNNSLSVSGFNFKNNSVNYNTTKITDNVGTFLVFSFNKLISFFISCLKTSASFFPSIIIIKITRAQTFQILNSLKITKLK